MQKKNFLPFSYKRLKKEFPDIEKEYDRLAKKCHTSGPLNEKMRRLIKLGIAIVRNQRELSNPTHEELWP
jgi:alkylhydroperoxidase/carboxymuconolactone decarboxylase family protein YurZ